MINLNERPNKKFLPLRYPCYLIKMSWIAVWSGNVEPINHFSGAVSLSLTGNSVENSSGKCYDSLGAFQRRGAENEVNSAVTTALVHANFTVGFRCV
jgi:hypothetical protein